MMKKKFKQIFKGKTRVKNKIYNLSNRYLYRQSLSDEFNYIFLCIILVEKGGMWKVTWNVK